MQSYQAIKITDNVYWVGAIDWGLRNFHGYNTSRGTTYNAYLILGNKPILVDTVKAPFFAEMLARISSVIDPQKIEYIISNHAEMDHSGCLIPAITAIQPEKVFASTMGVAALKEHLHTDLPLTVVANGEKLQLGTNSLQFLETRMLHWPDSMFTYYANDGILFTQDAFGMHLATHEIFAEQTDSQILTYEAAKYYANILLPYSAMVKNLLNKLPNYSVDIKILAPDHGPIWRKSADINFIINHWKKWANQHGKNHYQKIVITYDTMWNSTAKLANAIADGASEQENITVKVMPMAASHRSDIAAELLEAGAIIVGSPTLNQQMFPTLAELLCYLKGLKPKNLCGQAFGSYGWGGEATKLIQNELLSMQIELIAEPVNIKYVPDNDALLKCSKLGKLIAKNLLTS